MAFLLAKLFCWSEHLIHLQCFLMLKKLFHQRAWIIAETLMLCDAGLKAMSGLNMGLDVGAKVKSLVFFHLNLSKVAQMFNVAFSLWGFFDPCQSTKTKRCLGIPKYALARQAPGVHESFKPVMRLKTGDSSL